MDDRDDQSPAERREKPRVPAQRDVEIRIGDWYTTRLWPHDVSESGLRLTIPGGATPGQQYTLLLRHGDVEVVVLGQAQWVRSVDEEHTEVGLSFMKTDGTTPETLRLFFERLSQSD